MFGDRAPLRPAQFDANSARGGNLEDVQRRLAAGENPDALRQSARANAYLDELRAQGFDVETPLYRGMTRELEGNTFVRHPDLQGSEQFRGVSFSRSPREASLYADHDGGVVYPAFMRGQLADGQDYMREVQSRAKQAGISNAEAAAQIQADYAERGITGVEWSSDRYGKGGEVRIFDADNLRSLIGDMGEREAREVQARMGLTPEQRRTQAPATMRPHSTEESARTVPLAQYMPQPVGQWTRRLRGLLSAARRYYE